MFTGLLDKTCSTTRATVATTSAGDEYTYSANLTGVPCRISQNSSQELFKTGDGSNSEVATHKLWADYGTDITSDDRVTIGSTTYEVLDVNPDVAGAGHHITAMLREVRS